MDLFYIYEVLCDVYRVLKNLIKNVQNVNSKNIFTPTEKNINKPFFLFYFKMLFITYSCS